MPAATILCLGLIVNGLPYWGSRDLSNFYQLPLALGIVLSVFVFAYPILQAYSLTLAEMPNASPGRNQVMRVLVLALDGLLSVVFIIAGILYLLAGLSNLLLTQ